MPRNFTVSVSPNTSKTRPPSLQRVHQSDGYTFVNFDYKLPDLLMICRSNVLGIGGHF